jgi:aryl-alcohol dehydrogenase-like predicted oxidoreductase
VEYRILGRTGVKISPLALGTANFADPTPENEAKKIIDAGTPINKSTLPSWSRAK